MTSEDPNAPGHRAGSQVPQPAASPAAAAGLVVVATFIGALIILFAIAGADVIARMILSGSSGVSPGASVSVSLLLMQILIVVVVLSMPQILPDSRDALALNSPRAGTDTYAIIFWATLAFMAASYVFAFTVFRDQFVADLQTFSPLLKSEAWPVAAISITLGAPIAEELLFRGLLLGWLLQRGVGFLTAALSTNVMWTLLHVGYSTVGLFEVFLAGLLLSWAFYLTRSVWVPMIVHAAYNTLALVVMMTVII